MIFFRGIYMRYCSLYGPLMISPEMLGIIDTYAWMFHRARPKLVAWMDASIST